MNTKESEYIFKNIRWMLVLLSILLILAAIGCYSVYKSLFLPMPEYATVKALYPKYGKLKYSIENTIKSENSFILIEKKLLLMDLPEEALLFYIKNEDSDSKIVIYSNGDWPSYTMRARSGYGYGVVRDKNGATIETVNIAETIEANTELKVSYVFYFSRALP